MAKNKIIIIPKNISYYLSDEYPVFTGAYRYLCRGDYQAINAKSLRLGNNPNWSSKTNDSIDKVKVVADCTVIFNFHGDNCVYHVDSAFISDAIINCRTLPGGYIEGPFRFLKSSRNDYFLAREGSDIYKSAIQRARRDKLPKIKTKSFEVGGVYCTPSGTKSIYLGKVDTSESSYPDYNRMIELKNFKLFYSLRGSQYPNFTDLDTGNYTVSNFSFKNSHSFVELVEKISLPENVIHLIRDQYKKTFKNKLATATEDQNYIKYYLKYDMNRYSALMNMRSPKEKDFVNFDINKYLMIA